MAGQQGKADLTAAQPRKKRLAVARFWYEGNAFSPVPASFEDVRRREWSEGDDALAAARDTATELAAVEHFARTREDWDVTVLRCASSMPAGPMDDEVFETLKREITDGLIGHWDAIYLSLHGASITPTRQSPDIELLEAVRAAAPGVPVGASFDLHGNLGPRHGPLLDMAAGYRTYPHVDMREAAQRVLDGLVDIVEHGRRFLVQVIKPGLILPSFNMRTAAGPMQVLQDVAAAARGEAAHDQAAGREATRDPAALDDTAGDEVARDEAARNAAMREAPRGAVRDAIVFGGFPYADSRDTGASLVLVIDTGVEGHAAAAAEASVALLLAMGEQAPHFQVVLPSPRQALDEAVARIAREPGLFAITDPADNPLSGGTNDTTALFAALLATPDLPPTVFACFTSPEIVQRAHEGGVGQEFRASLGGQHSTLFGSSVSVQVRVDAITDGEFLNQGPMEHGVMSRCGRTALLTLSDHPRIRVIVTEAVAPTHDPGLFSLHQIDFSEVRLLCVKAKNHFRAAFGDRCTAIIDVDAPGPAALDLRLLPFQNAHV